MNGQHFSGTGYQLDGTENRDPILGIIVINPNLESIGETKITSQNYDAEFGQATAGVVSVQTKSGQNKFFGSAFEFYRSSATQSRNPFTQPTGRLGSRREEQSVRVRGSAARSLKNKSFFFGDYQGTRSTQGGSRLLDRADDGGAGTATSAPTGSTSTIRYSSADPAPRAQFAGNVIPANRLSPQALAMLALIPHAERAGS